MIVRESISFYRGEDPKDALGIGKRFLIEKWLEEMGVLHKCTINADLTIDSKHDLYIHNKNLIDFPEYIQFNRIEGIFSCNDNKLTSLRGCPYFVSETFFCSRNNLKSLEYCPKKVLGEFYCTGNKGRNFTKSDILKYCKVKPFNIVIH